MRSHGCVRVSHQVGASAPGSHLLLDLVYLVHATADWRGLAVGAGFKPAPKKPVSHRIFPSGRRMRPPLSHSTGCGNRARTHTSPSFRQHAGLDPRVPQHQECQATRRISLWTSPRAQGAALTRPHTKAEETCCPRPSRRSARSTSAVCSARTHCWSCAKFARGEIDAATLAKAEDPSNRGRVGACRSALDLSSLRGESGRRSYHSFF